MLNIDLISAKKRELAEQLENLEALEETIENILDDAAQELRDARDDIHCAAIGNIATEMEQAGFEGFDLEDVICTETAADEIDVRAM